jgi:hypothetical protein
VAARTPEGRKIRVRGKPRKDLDLHLLAQAVVMISEDLQKKQENREEPGHVRSNRPGACREEDA